MKTLNSKHSTAKEHQTSSSLENHYHHWICFSREKRVFGQIGEQSIEKDAIEIFRYYYMANANNAVFIEDEWKEQISNIVRKTFKTSSFKLVTCKMKREDVS